MAEVFVKFEAVQPKVSLKEALERISHEFGIDSNGCNLTIIDRYFLRISDEDVLPIAETLTSWLSEMGINKLTVYSENTHGKYAEALAKKMNGSVCCSYSAPFSNIHDRYWIICSDKSIKAVVSVGTSLNGLGKKYCSVNKLSEADVAQLEEFIGGKLCIKGSGTDSKKGC